MFHRLFIAGIVFFWMLMTGALVQIWLYPGSSEILTVPVTHVVGVIFAHEQPSNLSIFQGNRRVGALNFQPRRFDDEGLCTVAFNGSIRLPFPFTPEPHSFSWRGTAEMDRSFALRHFRIHIDAPTSGIATRIEIDTSRNRAVYTLMQKGAPPLETVLTLDRKGAEVAMNLFGLDPAVLNQIVLSAQNAADSSDALTLTARQAETEIRGEKVQTYRLVARRSDSSMAEIDVSQLGQILGIKTAFGFVLAHD